MNGMEQDLSALLEEYSKLSQQYQSLVVPFDARIKEIEISKEDATAHLTFQMETLETLIKPAVLALQETQKVPYVTAIYSHKDTWDHETLLTFAKEFPAIMQAYRGVDTVSLRKTKR
jgi:hypothetical protein